MKKLRILVIALLCVSLLAGCSTRMAEHSNTYFSQIANVFQTALNSEEAIRAAEEKASTQPTEDPNALPAPGNFTVSADGSYSFDAVENAEYYYLYVYEDAISVDASTSLQIMDDGSKSYSGNLNDLGRFSYRTWNIRVVAYPDYENSDRTASAESKQDYKVSGSVEYGEPSFNSMWTVSSNTLTLKVGDMEYGSTAYPTDIKLTLTNTADSSDVITLDITDVSGNSASVSTTEAKPGASYSIKADFTWDADYVSNPSFSTEGGKAETSDKENLISGEFYYSSHIFKTFDFPHVQKSFDPVKGGSAGVWHQDPNSSQGSGGWPGQQQESTEQEDKDCYFEAIPKAAENGAMYSYDIEITSPAGSITATPKLSPGSASTSIIFGSMDIFDDGTFAMEIEYQYIKTDMMNAAVYSVPGVICRGVYTENADGTLNLSYDHENAEETDYEMVTELTGKAAEYAKDHPDFRQEESGSGGGGSGGSEGQPGGEGEQPGGEGQQPGGEGEQPGGEGQQPGGEGEQPGGEGQQPGGEGSGDAPPSTNP